MKRKMEVAECSAKKPRVDSAVLRILTSRVKELPQRKNKREWLEFLSNEAKQDRSGLESRLMQKMNDSTKYYPILTPTLLLTILKNILSRMTTMGDIDTTMRLWTECLNLSNNFLIYEESQEVFDISRIQEVVWSSSIESKFLKRGLILKAKQILI